MRVSVVIPHYPYDDSINKTLEKCVDSLKGYDELILVVNEGQGFAKSVNQGLRLAKGDYICVVNNDIELVHGSVKDMADPKAVTSPVLNGEGWDFCGAFFCMPRWVYEKVGGLDEGFKVGYYEDDDFVMRLHEEGIQFRIEPKVFIESEGGQTMMKFDKHNLMSDNRQRFLEKWGREPIRGEVKQYEKPE